jgi:hypothetical protein
VGGAPESYAKMFAERAKKQSVLGTFDHAVEIVLQGRTSGRLEVKATDPIDARVPLSPVPLDVQSPVGLREADAAYVRSGVVPPGMVLLIEEVAVTCAPRESHTRGESRSRPSRVTVQLPDQGSFDVPCRGRMQALFRGRTIEWYPEMYDPEERTRATFEACAGSVVVRGRLLDRASLMSSPDRGKTAAEPFAPVSWDGEGVLGDRPTRIQILADHGGGNPRTVTLEGVVAKRFGKEAVQPSPIWDDRLDLTQVRESSAWVENAGIVPPGKAYEVRRIEWRVRFAPGERYRRATFVIAVNGKPLVEVPETSSDERERDLAALHRAGRWDGAVRIRPGEESRFEVSASYYSMSDTTIYGTVVDDLRK